MKYYTITGESIVITTKFPNSKINEFISCANNIDLGFNLMNHGFPYPYTEEDAMNFIDKNREDGDKAFAFDFYILYENCIVGVIGLSDIDYENSRAHIGYWLGKKYQGKGIGTEALKLIIPFSRKTLKLHSLHTSVLTDNIASIIVLTRNGFSMDGIIKDCFMWKNKFYPAFLFSRFL